MLQGVYLGPRAPTSGMQKVAAGAGVCQVFLMEPEQDPSLCARRRVRETCSPSASIPSTLAVVSLREQGAAWESSLPIFKVMTTVLLP